MKSVVETGVVTPWRERAPETGRVPPWLIHVSPPRIRVIQSDDWLPYWGVHSGGPSVGLTCTKKIETVSLFRSKK